MLAQTRTLKPMSARWLRGAGHRVDAMFTAKAMEYMRRCKFCLLMACCRNYPHFVMQGCTPA